ncbi:solute carrier family 23 member 2-like isoform X2 [Haliotis rubra]|uniref:solute carrier family 23 member 2-like isoform X2 n=1 Tax=Haliotis rubra TaxID=36100 RepID=UPI001EE585E6|nr:solute carrier family 23 member 2-like isoform X2 [Haliotis rubra]
MVVAVGLSTLQFVDLSSSRNLMVLGLALMLGMILPQWAKNNPKAIDTGTAEERGMLKWRKGEGKGNMPVSCGDTSTYNLTFITKYLPEGLRCSWFPVSPAYKEGCRGGHGRRPQMIGLNADTSCLRPQ